MRLDPRIFGLAGGLGLLAGCFSDGFLEGRPCTDDTECGSLGCNDGFCGSPPADAESGGGEADTQATSMESAGDGDGDGDGTTGDGDGDGFTGDGDGDGFTGDGDGDGFIGDGDGDGTTGDGDGDGTTGDGTTGDGTTGDGTTGDGTTGDGTTGDGDGTSGTSGDGDGDGTSGTSGDGDGDGTSGTSGDGDGTTATTGDGDGTTATTGDGDGDGTTATTGDGDGTTTGDGDGDGTTGDGDGTTGDGTTGDGDGGETLCQQCVEGIGPPVGDDCSADANCSCVYDCVDTNAFDWHFCVNQCGGMNDAIAAVQPSVYRDCASECPGLLDPNDSCEACDVGMCVGATGCIDNQAGCDCVALCDLADTNSTWFDCIGICSEFGGGDYTSYQTEACLRGSCQSECAVGNGRCTDGDAGCAWTAGCDVDICRSDAGCDCVSRCIDFGNGDWDSCEGSCGTDRASNPILAMLWACAAQSCSTDCQITVPAGACQNCVEVEAGCDSALCLNDGECGCVLTCMNLQQSTSGGPADVQACVDSCPGADTDPDWRGYLACMQTTTSCHPVDCTIPDLMWEVTLSGSASPSYDELAGVDIDVNGNIYVVGTLEDFQVTQGPNIFVGKYDGMGNEAWTYEYDGSNTGASDQDRGHGIDVTDDGTRLSVAGTTDIAGTAALLAGAYDTTGGVVWELQPTENIQQGYATAISPSGTTVFYGGMLYEFLGDEATYVRQYDDVGGTPTLGPNTFYEADTVGAAGADRFLDFAGINPFSTPMVIAAGYGETMTGGEDGHIRIVDPMGGSPQSEIIDIAGGNNRLDCVAARGLTVVTGGFATFAGVGKDFWVRKYTLATSPVAIAEDWTRSWDAGGNWDDEITACGIDSQDNIVVAGFSTGGQSYMRKYDSTGTVIWTRTLPQDRIPLDLAIAGNDQIVVVGRSTTIDDDAWMARFRP